MKTFAIKYFLLSLLWILVNENIKSFAVCEAFGQSCPTGIPLHSAEAYLMKEIQLTQGKIALVDDEKFEYLNQWKWCAFKGKKTFYACRVENKKTILLHRFLLNAQKGELVDHQDGNGLNCQMYNIRLCTSSQNAANRMSCGKSKYHGVYKVSYKTKKGIKYTYHVTVLKNKRIMFQKQIKDEIKAAKAYDQAALKYHGEFARLNFPNEI